MKEATLNLEIRPEGNKLIGTGYFPVFAKRNKPVFYINKDFKINKLEGDIDPMGFTVAIGEDPLPFIQKSRPVYFHKDAKIFKIQYEGVIDKPVGMCNVIKHDRIELSMHSSFYPIFINRSFDTIRVAYHCPKEYFIWTNGKSEAGLGIKYSFDEYARGLFFYAEKDPCIRKKVEKNDDIEIVGSDRRPKSLCLDEANLISEIIEYYRRKLQVNLADNKITLIYSERACGAYVFGQKITIPTRSEFEFLSSKNKVVNLIAHEIAHFYWNFADLSGNHDWITEGLAEYLAFSYSVDLKEKTTIKELLNDQYHEILGCATDDSILTTKIGSKDFNQNRGTKLSWLYLLIQQRYGDLDRCLSILLNKYKNTKIDTKTYMAFLRANISSEGYEFLAEFLNRKGWCKEDTVGIYTILLKNIGINRS